MFAGISTFFSSFKLEIYAAILAAAVTGCFMYGHAEYNKGYAAAAQKQTDAIVAYQKIVLDKQAEAEKALAELSTKHAQELADIQASIPTETEKTRVIVKTIERPASCNLTADELRDFNEAVNSANSDK